MQMDLFFDGQALISITQLKIAIFRLSQLETPEGHSANYEMIPTRRGFDPIVLLVRHAKCSQVIKMHRMPLSKLRDS